MILTALLFIAVLSVLVLAHEWGHYAAAKRAGMDIEEFGIGFPPRLFSWKDKNGTEWSINLVPLGGFVRIKGENGEERTSPGAFAMKSIPARFLVLAAGVLMNLFVAWILFTGGFLFGLPAVIEGTEDTSAIISDRALHIVQVLPESPAAEAGIEEGDKVISIDGESFTDGEAARAALTPNAGGEPIEMVFERDGETEHTLLTPKYIEEIKKEGVGVALVETGTVRYPFYVAPVKGVVTTIGMTVQIVGAFVGLVAGVFTKENVLAELSGPVGIAALTGEVARLGIGHLIQFAAMLSVNLAVLNAIPFPALDGGRMFFLAVEAIRRKPNSMKFEQAAHTLGFGILILLVIFVTYRDIVKMF